MRRPAKSVLISSIAAAFVVLVAGYARSDTDDQDRPKNLTHAAEIRSLVENAGWVSPGLSKTKALYMVSWEYCPPCLAYEKVEFPKLHAAGVDTRVIMYAHAGAKEPERAGVAELWKNRSWKTWEAFTKVPTSTWTAEGLPASDSTPERAALVKKSEEFADKMRVLMADNGIGTREHLNLPTLIWIGKDGQLRACGCEKAENHKYVAQELGAS